MEAGEWTDRDVSLPRLLSLVRAFVEMLVLASGFQRSASPAFWRPQEVSRALRWASILEQIIAKISGQKNSRESLDGALQALRLETFYPEGLPRLSCAVLGEAKNLLFHAMSHALGSNSGQIESLVVAAHKDERDQEAVVEQIRKRVVVAEQIKSALKALDGVATMPIVRNCLRCACQQWRQEAVSYLLKGATQYKVSGAAVLFKCSTVQWKTALQTLKDQSHNNKLADIVELCCLYISMPIRAALLTRLLEPCDKVSCLTEATRMWHPENHTMEGAVSKEMVAVEAFLYDLTQYEKRIWLSLPPILVAAALAKRSRLFEHYHAYLSSPIDADNQTALCSNGSERCASTELDTLLNQRYERKWCAWFVQRISVDDETLNERKRAKDINEH